MTPRRQRPRTADHAYADVLDAVGDVPWVHEIALSSTTAATAS
jgi:hypothetical protein